MDKTAIIEQQTVKLQEVIDALTQNFSQEEFVDEISFLTIVKEKLEDSIK